MIKILVIDDQQVFIDGIIHLFKNDRAYNIEHQLIDKSAIIDMSKVSEADIILLDIKMPGISGIDLSKEILKNHRFAKIIFMSVYHKKDLLFDIIETGAKGYISKNSRKSELEEAIIAVNGGKSFFRLPEK